jgi:Domain of unknown function (DUF4091)
MTHKKRASNVTLITLITLWAGASPLVFAQKVWVVPSLQRVGQTDSPGSETRAELWAARGEYESFQIVTHAPNSGLTISDVAVSDLTGPGGQVISKSNLTLYREYYIYISPTSVSPNWQGSNQPLGPGWYPDGLIPFVNPATGAPILGATLKALPYNLSAGINQTIWVDVFVPRTAEPGLYTGTYTVTSNQGSVSGQIALNVWKFTLPMQPSLKSSFGIWNSFNMATYETLLANRLMPDYGSPFPGKQQQTTLMNSYGLNAADLGFYSGASYGNCQMSAAPSVASIKTAAAAQQSGLLLYDYSADEIDGCTNLFSDVKQWARNLHAAGIDNLITMGPRAELFDDGSGTGRSAVDIWVVLPDTYNTDLGNVQLALKKGDQVWSYNTEVQDDYSPKWEIDFAPINFRIQPGFINQSLKLTGLLYWEVDRWSSNPWNNVILHDGGSTFPGDGELVYPGSTVGITGVAPSMRLKWLRDGADDYDYIQLLKQAGHGDWAMQIAGGVAPDWTNWTRDINALEAARLELGQMLNSLSK